MGDKFSRVSGLHHAEHKTFPGGLSLVNCAKESIMTPAGPGSGMGG
jgi:hypothetical protein